MNNLKKIAGRVGAIVFAWLVAGAVSTQTITDTVTNIFAVPNTGASDIVANLLLVGVSAMVIVVAGIFFLTRPGREQA